MDLRFSMPELRRQPALNLKVIQLQLDYASGLRKVSAHIPHADIKSGHSAAIELCLDHHRSSRIARGKTRHIEPVNHHLALVRQVPDTSREHAYEAICCLCWTQFLAASRTMRTTPGK